MIILEIVQVMCGMTNCPLSGCGHGHVTSLNFGNKQ